MTFGAPSMAASGFSFRTTASWTVNETVHEVVMNAAAAAAANSNKAKQFISPERNVRSLPKISHFVVATNIYTSCTTTAVTDPKNSDANEKPLTVSNHRSIPSFTNIAITYRCYFFPSNTNNVAYSYHPSKQLVNQPNRNNTTHHVPSN